MTETEYALCKWRKRWWPAKVLSSSCFSKGQSASKAKIPFIRVEIMRLNEQINVRCSNVRPLKEESIEEIASKLDQSKTRCSPTKELTYRHALREALDILHSALPSVDGAASKGSNGGARILKDRLLAATQQQVSSCLDPRQGEAAGISPLLSTFGAPVQKRKGSTKRTGTSADFVPSVSKYQGLSDYGKRPGLRRGASKTKRPVAPSEEAKPAAEPHTGRKSLSPAEKDQVSGVSVKKRGRPLSALKCFVQTSTPARPFRVSSSLPASEGGTPVARPRLRKTLWVSPLEPALPKAHPFSREGEDDGPPADKFVTLANGSNPLNGANGTRGRRNGRTPRKWRRKLCLENLNLELHSGESVLEGEAERSQNPQAEPLQREGSEGEEGENSTSDLSLRLSPIREASLSPALREEDEEEELPSILPPQEPGSIEAGKLVWCKLPRYPYWPAVVRKITRKPRKANVFLVEKAMEEKSKGFSISLRKLKPFDCPEKQQLISGARDGYSHEIDWCINLIEDYRIRVGCCSFTGSFLEYCTDAMSYPVRKETPLNLSQMNFPQVDEREVAGKSPPAKVAKKVLPDRTRASRDRANGKIVDFIVKAKGAEGHLWSVLKNEKPSRWLAQFLQARPSVASIETYLEDDAQQDLVFNYLQGVYREANPKTLSLVNGDRVEFILDVLFPEAIIYAISAVDQIGYRKAEEKYINGPLISQREREKFEEEILEQKKRRQAEKTSPEDSL